MITKIVGHTQMTGMMKKLRGGPQSMLPTSPMKGSGTPNRTGVTPQAPRNYVTPKQAPTQPAKPKLGLGMMVSPIGADQMKARPTSQAATAPPVAPASPQQMAAGRTGKASGGEAGVFAVAKRGLGLGNERPKSMGGGKPPKKG